MLAKLIDWCLRISHEQIMPAKNYASDIYGLKNYDGRTYQKPYNIMNQEKAYTDWVYACVSAIAKDVAINDFWVTKKETNRFDHPLSVLLKNPNERDTEYNMSFGISTYLDLTGNAFIYLAPNRMGLPTEMWLIPPSTVQVIPSTKNFIKGYEINMNGKLFQLSPAEILHMKTFNPNNLFYGQ